MICVAVTMDSKVAMLAGKILDVFLEVSGHRCEKNEKEKRACLILGLLFS